MFLLSIFVWVLKTGLTVVHTKRERVLGSVHGLVHTKWESVLGPAHGLVHTKKEIVLRSAYGLVHTKRKSIRTSPLSSAYQEEEY